MKRLLKDAEKNIRYVISKGSACETFQKGDHIKVLDNGDVLCREGMGWQDAEAITDLLGKVEIIIDKEEIANLKIKISRLQTTLKWMTAESNKDQQIKTGIKNIKQRAHAKKEKEKKT